MPTIKENCEKYGIYDYTINRDGSIDVFEDVFLEKLNLVKFPIRFNIIHGNFNCDINQLISLKGGPKEVRGWFSCQYNQLTNLAVLCIKRHQAFEDNYPVQQIAHDLDHEFDLDGCSSPGAYWTYLAQVLVLYLLLHYDPYP